MKLLEQYKIKIFYLLATIVLITVFVIFYYNTQKVKATNAAVNHTQEVLRKNDNVFLDLLNIETSSRGFVLSGNKSFLEPYYTGVAAMKTDLDALADLSKGNSSQFVRIDSLKKYILQRMLLSNTLVNITKEGALDGKTEIEIINEGKKITDTCRNLIAAINQEEFELLKQGKFESDKNNQNSIISGLINSLAYAIGLISLYIEK